MKPDLLATLTKDKPLIICDVDEVVLHFVKPFEDYLRERKAILKKDSFKLSGNILNQMTGKAISKEETSRFVQDFHVEAVDKQPLIEGAKDVLSQLSQSCQILFLTNVNDALQPRREAHLHHLGLPYPVVANEGSKADYVSMLHDHVQAGTFFIDDLPPHHHAVKSASPSTMCIHFMADESLRRLVSIEEHIAIKTESWLDILNVIDVQLS